MSKILVCLFALMILSFAMTSCGLLGESGNSHEHDFSNWEIDYDATCMSEGQMIGTCDCGEETTAIIPKKSCSR